MSQEIAPVIFSAENISVTFGTQIVLKNSSLTVHEGEKIGLVGRNGCGKSTFLKIIAGLAEPDSGIVMKKKELTSSYLSQENSLIPEKTVYESVLEGAANITELIKKYETISHDSREFQILENQINLMDGWNLENKIERVLHAVNAPDHERIIASLSGGERRRTALAQAIIGEPDLLILDEPTNHLDTDSVEWLEKYIASYKGTIVFVTHDRYFLDNLATKIVELSNGNFYSYEGCYSDYLIGKAKRIEIEEKLENKRKSFIRREIDWIRRMPKARTCKSASRVDRFNQAASQLPPERESDIELIIPPPRQLSDKVLECTNLSFSYDNRTLFKDFNILINPGIKIGLIGKNGSGKTTFLKTLTGDLLPSSGAIFRASNLEFNYVDQERIKLSEENTVYDEIGEGYDFVRLGEHKISIWTYLKRFLFEDARIKTRVSELSGGEKGRLILAKILKKGGNFLILDEPTNDLDLQTLRILEEVLIDFKGCVILVSHDRYFLNRVCSSILAFEGNNLNYYVGNYDYYYERNRSTQSKIERTTAEKKIAQKQVLRKLTWKEEKELESIEDRIMDSEGKITSIENIFASPDFFEKYGSRIQELQKDIDSEKKVLGTLYSRWDELEKIKSATAE